MNGFDESEFDPPATPSAAEVETTTAQAAADFTDDLLGSEEGVEEEIEGGDDYMAEIDRCFEIASYYRQLLRAPLFRDGNEIADIVEGEVRGFVRERLGALLNRPQEAPPPVVVHHRDFDDEQVQALKMVADRILKRGVEAPVAPPAKATPTITPVEPPAPAPPPRHVTPAAPPPPAIKPAPAPAAPPPTVAPAALPRRTVPARIKRPAPKPAAKSKPATPPAELAPAPAPSKVVTVENSATGEQREVTLSGPRVQNPAGRIPFKIVPNGGASIESATAAHAAMGVRDPHGMLAGVVALATSRE